MIIQQQLIEKVRQIAMQDANVSAVLMYGSFVKGEGDRYSDIEFYVFTEQEPDKREWINRIAPVDLLFANEHGTDVAVFHNLVRGEFHFHDVSQIEMILSWQGFISFRHRDKMVIADKEGLLKNVLDRVEITDPYYDEPEYRDTSVQQLVNYLIFSRNVILRGETAHAHHLFFFIENALLRLIRLHTGCTQHFEAPGKKLETDVPAEWYARYADCVPGLSHEDLERCHENSVRLAVELSRILGADKEYIDVLERINEIT